MTTQVEKVARAIYEEMGTIMGEKAPDDWGDLGLEHDIARAEWLKVALAALRALREPSRAMIVNGLVLRTEVNLYEAQAKTVCTWEAMIDAAIQEAETA